MISVASVDSSVYVGGYFAIQSQRLHYSGFHLDLQRRYSPVVYLTTKTLCDGPILPLADSPILLIPRGDCSLAKKSKNAFHSNATGLIIQNTDDSIFNFGLEYEKGMVPVISVTKSAGEKMQAFGNYSTVFFERPLKVFASAEGYSASNFSSVKLILPIQEN